jgi:hypothetical protein
MASLEQQRWLRFGWNAARYALGPIGGLLVPWLVINRGGMTIWGDAVGIVIVVQLYLHVGGWGSKEFLLRQFATAGREPWSWSVQSTLTRGVVFVPILVLLGLLGGGHWMMASLWAFVAFGSAAHEPLFVWRKRFGMLLFIDAAGLIAQCAVLLSATAPDVDDVLLSYLMNGTVRLAIIGIVVQGWSGVRDPMDGFRFSFHDHFMAAFPFFLIGFSGLLASRIDLYTANALLDRTEVARYQIVSSLFIQFQALAALVVVPLTRDLFKLSVASVSRYARRIRTWALMGLVPMCALAWAVFTLLFRFDLEWPVYVAACALVWPVFGYVPFLNQLYKHGRERRVMWANFAAAALSCGLTVVLLPLLGLTGGLLAAAAGQWLMLLWMMDEQRRLHALSGM